MSKDKLHELLCQVWHREISADDAFDALEDLINRITQLETENDAMRADLLLWRDTTDAICSKAGIGFTTEAKP